MFSKTLSFTIFGIDATYVQVEVDIRSMGLPTFNIVGLPEGPVKESKERVKSSLKNMGFDIFDRPIIVNLAPADMKKEGSHFDLPIAMGILKSSGIIQADLDNFAFAAELSLDGKLRGVPGILPFVSGLPRGTNVIVAESNQDEASVVEGINVYGFDKIGDILKFLNEGGKEPYKSKIDFAVKEYGIDFSDVRGQFTVKRGAEIAAAGMHNILMMGPPGSGKTMIAKRIPTIMPPMTLPEALQTTRVHSVAGMIMEKGGIVSNRPFIVTHPTASDIALVGGSKSATPGLVSIATNGILFMDEFLEFKKSVIETLRQPLEDGVVTVSRASRTVVYPANFMLVASCNPCPCGFYGTNRECTCTMTQIQKYKSKMSGPIMDRIDLHLMVEPVDIKQLGNLPSGKSSADIIKHVQVARDIQRERFKNENIQYNSRMNEKMLKTLGKISPEAYVTLEQIATKLKLSARSYMKILKVSRTIADLESVEDVLKKHVMEACQYRFNEVS